MRSVLHLIVFVIGACGGARPAAEPGVAAECNSRETCNARCVEGSTLACDLLVDRVGYDSDGPRYGTRAEALYQLACDHGSARGCYAAALIYEHGLGVTVDVARARPLFERAATRFAAQCREGHSESCYGEAELHRRATPPDLARARAAAEEGCNGNSGLACLLLFRLRAAEGLDAADVHTKALARLEIECDGGSRAACLELESETKRTKPPAPSPKPPPSPPPSNPTAGVRLDGVQCTSDPPDLCDRLPELISNWAGAALDTLTVELDREGCAHGSEPSCYRVGMAQVAGTGVKRDAREGFARIDAACTAGEALACEAYARAIDNYLLGGREPKDALPYRQRGCEMGNRDACYALGRAKFEGTGPFARPLFGDGTTGIPADVRDGVALIERACDLDLASACAELGRIYFNGWHLPADKPRGLAKLRTACLIGGPDECESERAYRGQ